MDKHFFVIYLWCVGGVVISILLPALRAMLPKPPAADVAGLAAGENPTWQLLRPYVAAGLFSALAALLIVSFVPDLTEKTALLAGYTWDSTVQRVRTQA